MDTEIKFTYFIRKGDGSVIAAGCKQDGHENIYYFDSDGSVKTKDNEGFWHELDQAIARKIRSLAARIYKAIPNSVLEPRILLS